ncbi:MAG: hypothetical protein ACXWM6_05060, partial [Thermodesulfobacteriota bacterium]
PLFVALVGIVLERGLLRSIEDKPITTIICTFGVMLAIQQIVLTIFGGLQGELLLRFPTGFHSSSYNIP